MAASHSQRYAGKLLVITGGGSGIGRETALAFARLGAEMVLSDINLAAAEETAAMIAGLGGSAHAYELNVADEAAVLAHADAVAAAHGVPDILINNAGIGHADRFLQTPAADFKRVMDINLYGVIHGCRAFGAKMVERGARGHIVNLSSMAAYSPQQSFDKLYARRHYTPDKVADRIVRAVQRKRSIVPVTPESHLAYHLQRLVPAIVRWVAAKKDIIN